MIAPMPRNLIKRGKKWYGYYKDASGKWRYKALCADLKMARVMLAELERNARRAALGLEDEIRNATPIARLLDAYLADGRNRWTPKHAHDVEQGLRSMLKGMENLSEICIERIQARRDAHGGSNRTKNKLVSYVQAWLRWLETTGRISRSPLGRTPKLPLGGRHQVRTRHRLTAREADRVQRAVDKTPIGDLVALLLGTGMRLGEALSLTWDDFSGNELSLSANRTKTGRARKSVMAEDLRVRLRGVHAAQGARLGRLPAGSDRIILGVRGGPMNPSWASKQFRQALDRAGIKRQWPDGSTLDFHALRHTYATWLGEAGIDLGTASAALGHASPATTARIYQDLTKLPLEAAAKRVADLRAKPAGYLQDKNVSSGETRRDRKED